MLFGIQHIVRDLFLPASVTLPQFADLHIGGADQGWAACRPKSFDLVDDGLVFFTLGLEYQILRVSSGIAGTLVGIVTTSSL